MKTVKSLIKYIAVLLTCILIATVIMSLLYALPVREMKRHAAQSKTMFYEEIIHNWCGDFGYTKLDTYTDSIMINVAVTDAYDSPIRGAMLNPNVLKYSGVEAERNLIANLNDEPDLVYSSYSRYWHGYLLYLKPLLLFFNICDIKMLMLFVQLMLIVWVEILLAKESESYAMFFGLVILFLNPITTVMSFQFADIMMIALLSMIVVLRRKTMSSGETCLLFLLNGVAVAFFDFLTYPVAAIGIPLITLLLVNSFSLKESFKRIVFSSLAWGSGYGVMWAGKWIVAYLLTGENVAMDGLSRVSLRLGTAGVEAGSWLDTISGIFWIFANRPMYVLAIAAVVFSVVFLTKSRTASHISISRLLPMALVGLFPFFWFFVVRNHSFTHPVLEFRNLSVTFWAVLSMVLKSRPPCFASNEGNK